MTTKQRTVLWVLGGLLVVSLFGIAMSAAHLLGYDPTAHAAPEFSLPVADGTSDRVSLSGLRGEVVLIDFWASWCGPCRASIPALNRVHERYGERVRMYGINVESDLSDAHLRAAHHAFGAHFPTLRDENGRVQQAYDVDSIPTIVLIDRSGDVRWVHTGVPDPDELAEHVETLLAANR